MKISSVDPASPLFGYVRPGYTMIAINERPVRDLLDFQYKATGDHITIRFADARGRAQDFEFEELYPGELGLTFEDDRVRVCKCNCVFCFVRQQPKGMRRALYVRDEDYRLSFTHGNFVTLSNVTEEDIERIVEQRLSPLYVSVHATDDSLRRCMLRNEKLEPIIPRLRYLTERGITVHTQVVLCPGFNDGDQLARTIDDLAALYPATASLAVVPVGLTRYRDRLPKLRAYTCEEAGAVIDYVESRQGEFLKALGSRFVWAADEFYVSANRDFPPRVAYEEMEQFENGVGMAREFVTGFNRRRRWLTDLRSNTRALFLTGESAGPMWRRHFEPYIREELGVKMAVAVVQNRFWGDKVTVSGLLTGKDMLREAKRSVGEADAVVLPPNCLNADELFLDDMSLATFRKKVGKRVVVGDYDLAATLKEVYQ